MKKFLKEFYPYLIIAIVVILIRSFIATPVRVDGDSMVDTLHDGEILILNKLSKIKRYDIVVLEDSDADNIIKRVYGMPGETIRIENSKIYINAFGETSFVSDLTLEDDEYFVLGDNREISKDSRVIGPIKKENIKGVTIFRLFPFKKMGAI